MGYICLDLLEMHVIEAFELMGNFVMENMAYSLF